MMDLRPFFQVFTANITADDVAAESRRDLSQLALNVADVVRIGRQPAGEVRNALTELLAQWEPARVRTYFTRHDYDWFATPEREALLRELLGEVAAALGRA
jgi:hypothetical protein